MKSYATAAILALGATLLAQGRLYAQEPLSIARTAVVQRAESQVFETLKSDLSTGRAGLLELKSANQASGTLAAARDHVDSITWRKWAYCKLGPLDMFDSLQDGRVSLRVNLAAQGKTSTRVRAGADFTGVYRGFSAAKTVRCVSLGVLEQEVLRLAGAAQR